VPHPAVSAGYRRSGHGVRLADLAGPPPGQGVRHLPAAELNRLAYRFTGRADPCRRPPRQRCGEGIRRQHAAEVDQAPPLTPPQLWDVLAALPAGLASARDRALLLVGFVATLRRSELAGVCVEHLAAHPKGQVLNIPRSKSDQHREGQLVDLPYATPRTLPSARPRRSLPTRRVRHPRLATRRLRPGHRPANTTPLLASLDAYIRIDNAWTDNAATTSTCDGRFLRKLKRCARVHPPG
jgi:hypothetical protein